MAVPTPEPVAAAAVDTTRRIYPVLVAVTQLSRAVPQELALLLPVVAAAAVQVSSRPDQTGQRLSAATAVVAVTVGLVAVVAGARRVDHPLKETSAPEATVVCFSTGRSVS